MSDNQGMKSYADDKKPQSLKYAHEYSKDHDCEHTSANATDPTDLPARIGDSNKQDSASSTALVDRGHADKADTKLRQLGHGLKDRTDLHRSHQKSESKKRDKKKLSKKRRRDDDDSRHKDDDSESTSTSDDYSSYSDDSDNRRRRRHHKERKSKKHKRDSDRLKDKKSKKKKHKKERSRNERTTPDNCISEAPTFGQYGIVKASDMAKMQRSFEIWLSEVHGVHVSTSNIPRYELQQYFDTYREDFNTATLPHIKYYDFDKWELEEHEKQKQEMEQSGRNGSAIINDERNHAIELQRIAKLKEEAALQFVAATMNTEKVKEMQHQKQLQTQMQMAFKMGDHETYRKIKEKLQPPDK